MITSIPPKPVDDYEFDAHGFVVHRGLIPEPDIDRYVDWWRANLTLDDDRYSPEPHGLRYLYTDHPEVRDLLCHPQIRAKFEELDLGDLAVHSDILNWRHAGAGWHCDVLQHLERPHCGAWIALADIPRRAGWFGIYPESHKWDKDLSQCGLTPDSVEPTYHVQDILSVTLMEPVYFNARKGDVLIWNTHCFHGALLQKTADDLRMAAIAHLGEDPRKVRHGEGMWYVP
jgi:hypothetical protein